MHLLTLLIRIEENCVAFIPSGHHVWAFGVSKETNTYAYVPVCLDKTMQSMRIDVKQIAAKLILDFISTLDSTSPLFKHIEDLRMWLSLAVA